jgi:two-component system NtrC family sensor kinase
MAHSDLILLALENATLLEKALHATGYETVTVHHRDALEKLLQESTPALVLLGETLGEEDGIEISKALVERFPTLPILFFPLVPSQTQMRKAFLAGVSGYLQPPLRIQEIVEMIQSSVERAHRMGDWVRREIKRTTASLEKRVSELEMLVKLGRDITGSLDLETVLANVVEAAVETTGAEEGLLLMLDEASGDLYLRAEENFEESLAHAFRLPVQDTLAGEVIRSGKPLLINSSESKKIKTAYFVQSLIYVPIRKQEEVIGILGIDNRRERRPFTNRDLLLMSVLADYAAIAIENARLYQVSETMRLKFEAVFNNIEDGVILLDKEEKILLINPAMATLFGLSETAVLGKSLTEAITHPDIRNLLQRSENQPLRYHEINFDDGRVFSAQYTPVPNMGAAITMQDITYLKELDRMKSGFVYTVSHDLRSPLTAVLGYAELLERIGPLNDKQSEFVKRIRESVKDITELINDLLDLGRIEAGFDTRREVVRLDGVLRYTLDNLMQQAKEKNLDIQLSISPDLPPLRGNPIRLRQMLDNLIGNAIKYTPERKRISIELNAEDDQIILKVADEGPGIPPQDQPHIFDKFYRASNISEETSGTGLGLAIVKTIVEGHQGRIWVDSSLGKGSTFFVVLPTYTPESNETERAS